jgi:hypothetical protein
MRPRASSGRTGGMEVDDSSGVFFGPLILAYIIRTENGGPLLWLKLLPNGSIDARQSVISSVNSATFVLVPSQALLAGVASRNVAVIGPANRGMAPTSGSRTRWTASLSPSLCRLQLQCVRQSER